MPQRNQLEQLIQDKKVELFADEGYWNLCRGQNFEDCEEPIFAEIYITTVNSFISYLKENLGDNK